MTAARRVAITGAGAICAAGLDVASMWDALCAGRSGIAHDERAGRPLARVRDYDAAAFFEPRALAMLDRASQFALVAAREAMAGAGLKRPADADIDPTRCGAVLGAGLGHETLDDGYQALYGRQAARLHPFLVPRAMPSAPASQLSLAYGLQGPTFAVASACASSAHAIGLAFQFIRGGLLDMALAGGSDAPLVPGMLKAWEGLRVLSDDTCRPFSRDRSGLVMGEGAALLVLEDWQLAQRRGASVLAEVVGFGMSADAHDITAPSADGAARAMHAALHDAGAAAHEVDYVNAHGTGTRLNDRCEAQALGMVFGPRLPTLPVSSCKGQIGHTLNAGGALEALATVLSLRDAMLPPSANFTAPDPEIALDCVPNVARAQAVELAMCNSFAFGGLNAVLLLRRTAG